MSVFRSPMWPWMLVSGIVHALLALFGIVLGVSGSAALAPGRGVIDGDGFGGSSVELEIEGPTDRPATGSLAPQAAIPEVIEPEAPGAERPALSGELPVAMPERPRPTRPARQQAPRPGAEDAPPEAEGDPEGVAEAAPGEGETGGSGGDDSTAGAPAGDARGLILGSIGLGGDQSARQALLPNGGACSDPAVGTWRAQKFRATDSSWVRFILHVRRDGDRLEGTITSRIWTGRASDPRPGACTAFGSDHTWVMSAEGRIHGEHVSFAARRARMVAADCPRSGTTYAPDRFHGTIAPMSEVFHAVNNDGAYDVDEPYTFRRVSCEP